MEIVFFFLKKEKKKKAFDNVEHLGGFLYLLYSREIETLYRSFYIVETVPEERELTMLEDSVWGVGGAGSASVVW